MNSVELECVYEDVYEDAIRAGITGDACDAWIWELNNTMF